MRLTLSLLLTFCVLWIAACGENEATYETVEADTTASYSQDYEADVVPTMRLSEAPASEFHSVTRNANNPIAELPTAASQRKIIYTGRASLVVDDFEGVPAKVTALAKKHGGFVASSSIRGSDGEPRRGDWTLRIPSTNYDEFIAGSEKLGQVRELTSDSKEVTAEFVDLQARSSNLRAEEKRLHRHLEESTKSLKDILEVEREIARVRGEAERIEGRLNVLKDLTALSTITLTIEEIKNYVPEPTQEPGYTTQVARVWDSSLGAVGGFFTRLSLGVVGLVPWLLVILPTGVVVMFVGKRVRKYLKTAANPAAEQPA